MLVAATDRVRRFAPDGTAGTSFDGSASGIAFASLVDIAIQDDGDVIVIDGTRVVRFKDDDSYAATLTGTPAEPGTLAAAPTGDGLLIGQNGGYSADFSTLRPSATISRYSGDSLKGTIELPVNVQGLAGMAISGDSSHQLYATAGPGRFASGDVNVQSPTPFAVQAPTVANVTAGAGETVRSFAGRSTPTAMARPGPSSTARRPPTADSSPSRLRSWWPVPIRSA